MSSQPTQGETRTTGSVVCRTHVDGTERVSTSVLLALDSLPGFDVESSDDTLFEHVDPDALDALFRSPSVGERAEGRVCFPFADYEVCVAASGEIVVRTRSSGVS